MTTEEIQGRISNIHILKISDDDEAAHESEDRLHLDFIKYVATLDDPLAAKAKLVASTEDIDFFRWFS